MNSQHFIEEVCFDISFATENEAFSQQESLGKLVKGALLTEVEDAFSRCADQHQAVIRIDQLHIDLGEVPFDNYPYEMKRRLRERLREQLQQRLHELKMQVGSPVEMMIEEPERGQIASAEIALVEQPSIDLEVMRSYLHSGYLPWCYQGKEESEIQPLFMRVIETQSDELARLLFSLSNREQAAERLLDILPPQGVVAVVRRLLRHHFAHCQSLVDTLFKRGLVGGSLENRDRLGHAISRDDLWRYVLKRLLRPGVERQSFTEMANDLVVFFGGDPTSAALKGIISLPGSSVIADELKVTGPLSGGDASAYELGDESGCWPRNESTANRTPGENEKLSAADLAAMLTNSGPDGLRKLFEQWDYLFATHATLLERLLTVHGRTRVVRRRLTRELSPRQLGELIGLISPRAAGFVNDAVALFNGGQLVLKNSGSATLAKNKAHSALSGERNLWGFTFDFFFIERGSRFNKKEYCGSLLREMAAHNNCAYGELLIVMQQWLLSISGHSSYAAELLSIIEELSGLPQAERVIEQEHPLRPYAECLISAFDEGANGHDRRVLNEAYSQFYRRYLAAGQQLSSEAFVRVFTDRLIDGSVTDDAMSDPQSQCARIISGLRKNSQAKRSVIQKVIDVLSDLFKRNSINNVIPLNEEPLPARTIAPADGDTIYVKNAGQVLLAPYIPVLFERLGAIKRGRFVDDSAALRAVHALQYMVDGEGNAPEYMMVLNKLICGVDSVRAVTRAVPLAESEKSLIDGLLTAAIENWKKVGNTSIEGLRESFLQREGRLQRKEGQWYLLVEARSYDMLLDQLPWSYATIKYGWMKDVIHVEWR